MIADAEKIQSAGSMLVSRLTFSLTAVDEAHFGPVDVLTPSNTQHPIGIALGELDDGPLLDLVALGCIGTETGCRADAKAEAPFGEAALTVIYNVANNVQPAVVEGLGGILPSDVVIADFMPPIGRPEIAVLHARRADCQTRTCFSGMPCPCSGVETGPCPCEGAEIAVYLPESDRVRLQGRYALTGSNAVSLAAIQNPSTGNYVGLASAAQGRSVNGRRCNSSSRCLDYRRPECSTRPELCGCPPDEQCELGLCIARDKLVDLFYWMPALPDGGLVNFKGCHDRQVVCDNTDFRSLSTCVCGDEDRRQNRCREREGGCNCRVPDRIYIGNKDSPSIPYDLVAGSFNEPRSEPGQAGMDTWQMIVAADGGLEIITGNGIDGDWKWIGEPLINAPINRLVAVDLDSELDVARGAGSQWLDVAWIADKPCNEGRSFQASCPMIRSQPGGSGCLGVYTADGAQEGLLSELNPAKLGCRRLGLDFAPAELCSGHFNADSYADIAVSAQDRGEIFVFLGDGRGGILVPPEVVSLPSGARGGPMACGDLESDGSDEIVVADDQTAALYILRAGS